MSLKQEQNWLQKWKIDCLVYLISGGYIIIVCSHPLKTLSIRHWLYFQDCEIFIAQQFYYTTSTFISGTIITIKSGMLCNSKFNEKY